MTGLIAGSMLSIALAAAALVFGWAGASEPLVWMSIAASVAAGVCLALAYHQSRNLSRRPPRRTRRPDPAREDL